LIIDDEVDFPKLVKRNLELIGDFTVTIANDGKQGLDLTRSLKPDLVLLDIMMPRIDGFKILERLKGDADTAPIPVIVVTARGDEASRARAMQLQCQAYINKPVGAVDLKVKIEDILQKSDMED